MEICSFIANILFADFVLICGLVYLFVLGAEMGEHNDDNISCSIIFHRIFRSTSV